MPALDFTIAAVERDTGLSKDVLRMWERRYRFPVPDRDQYGDRRYSVEQVERLRLIKRLMDQGHRPGKLIAMPAAELAALSPRRERPATEMPGVGGERLEELLALIKRHDADGYVHSLQQQLLRLGLQAFVLDIVAPLTHRVGEAWEEGVFEIFEEHLFTEFTKRVLRQAISSLPRGSGKPRVLLTSVPEEQHALGLLMVESLLALEGAECIPLGTQMPLREIARAAVAHRANIVALSFSMAFPARRIPALLAQLREMIAAPTQIWVGGSGASRLSGLEGVLAFQHLADCVQVLAAWRNEHA